MSMRPLAIGRRTFLATAAGGTAATLLGLKFIPGPLTAEPAKAKSPELALFQRILARHQDMTYDELHAKLYKQRDYVGALSFDPTQAAYFDRVNKQFQLTEAELGLFKKQGFVSIDQGRRHSFASAYFQIYAQDLPVLITTDSVMHALHRSYDEILMELEATLFTWTIEEVLADCHQQLGARAGKNRDATLAATYRDVDLYLTVARNLLAGAGAPEADPDSPGRPDPEWSDVWIGGLLVPGQCGPGDEPLARLKDIRSLRIEIPLQSPPTKIYGGERYVDYSQFKPRGHYTKSTALKRYFRCMTWLGRADCGWNVLPTDATHGVRSDSDRELRNAVLLVELLGATGTLERLKALDDIINFMVGKSDNLTVFALDGLLKEGRVRSLTDARDADKLAGLKKAIESGKHARQTIRSQVIASDPGDTYQVPPPSTFQVFGQRFIIDSFVLSQVVFDSVVFHDRKQKRMMPAGLDVMAALGNGEAVPLLSAELKKWNYSANLMACREFVDLHPAEFWRANLYNLWLDCLRVLDDDPAGHKHFPEAMRTRAWQMKQLQAQLGSWAELRHDTVLYAQQSYTVTPACEYPAGYVEPYPAFYAKVKFFAEEAGRLFQAADYSARSPQRREQLRFIKQSQEKFFHAMAQSVAALETLARKELNAEPFTEQEKAFLKKTVDMRGGFSGPPRYNGWYCGLFYRQAGCAKWDPTVTDVHTDPDSNTCLEVAVGDVNFGIIAINSEEHRMVFVGPLFSYYEFRHPVRDRLTDPQWQQMIASGKVPPRPEWVRSFQGPARRAEPVPGRSGP